MPPQAITPEKPEKPEKFHFIFALTQQKAGCFTNIRNMVKRGAVEISSTL
jgi:hypothetical protein